MSRPGRAARRRSRTPPPPLPQRHGLDPIRWAVPRDHERADAFSALLARFPALGNAAATPLGQRFARGDIVAADGIAWSATDPVGPGDQLWFHRELREEHVPSDPLDVLFQDEQLLVLDKPHGMATMPRGAHVLASALVRLRRATGLTTLTPLHRLDRRTAGVLAFGIRPCERSAYQQLFARGDVTKDYEARVRPTTDSSIPRAVGERAVLQDRLHKRHGELTTQVLDGQPNATTHLEVAAVEADGTVRLHLRPLTGRTHQLRAQLSARGAPILGDDLYPQPRPEPQQPLQLLARTLAFTDPLSGQQRRFTSRQQLPRETP